MPKRSPQAGKRSPTVAEAPATTPEGVDERGAFAYAACPECDWRGPGRRSRDRARKDLRHHIAASDGHIALAEDLTP
jgi:hypothetical protein